MPQTQHPPTVCAVEPMTGPGSSTPPPEQTAPEERVPEETVPEETAPEIVPEIVPGEPTSDAPATDGEAPDEAEWQRRKRLAAVFGDVLPDATRDERGPGAGTPDDWFRSQVPPHHG